MQQFKVLSAKRPYAAHRRTHDTKRNALQVGRPRSGGSATPENFVCADLRRKPG
ncbi:hypothetical protein I6F26_04445 [Ensifer sp. IC3342]|nr:hypothetical protein [Ensifer sp. BRP08]MCA1445842.1 hypothetical protein [Ensifer sp. IC3342]